MKTKIKIIPPEGYEIDKENSTFDCIKFKPIAKKWRDKKDKKLNGFYIGIDMTQEDKELLLKDLSARLPYGVICKTSKGNGHLCSINQYICGIEYGINIKATERDYFNDEEEIKPYLRPMSSMTEEELEAFYNLCFEEEREVLKCGEWVTKIYYHDTIYSIDWLNKNMFDYRGLIPKDLALSTDDFNPYKN